MPTEYEKREFIKYGTVPPSGGRTFAQDFIPWWIGGMLALCLLGLVLLQVGKKVSEPYAVMATQTAIAITQQAKIQELSIQATAEAETGYNPSNITINDSNCVAVGIEGNTQSVNCNITPQP